MFINGLDKNPDFQAGLLGSPDQQVGVERYAVLDNSGTAAPILFLRNPAGFSGEILLDRALDLGAFFAAGISLGWKRPAGLPQSAAFSDSQRAWARSFAGGLLSTCGLESTGQPSVDQGREFGLHGRIGHIPVNEARWDYLSTSQVYAAIDGFDLPEPPLPTTVDRLGATFHIYGTTIESTLGSPTLLLERHLFFSVERPSLLIVDEVRNVGPAEADHMFRHHFNLGFPLVQSETVVTTNAEPLGSRDGQDIPPVPWHLGVDTSAESSEEVFYFSTAQAPHVKVASPTGHTLEIGYSAGSFPYLIAWRDATAGVNVLGLEPSTSLDDGRAAARKQGLLVELPVGDKRSYWTSLVLEAT